jgi:hypothetical protein
MSKIPTYEDSKQDLIQSALSISVCGVLPGIFMTAILEFVPSALFLNLCILPINVIVLIIREPGLNEHRFLFRVVAAVTQILYNFGKSVPK